MPVGGIDRFNRLLGSCKSNESEAFGPSSLPVFANIDSLNLSELHEEIFKLPVLNSIVKVSDVHNAIVSFSKLIVFWWLPHGKLHSDSMAVDLGSTLMLIENFSHNVCVFKGNPVLSVHQILLSKVFLMDDVSKL